MDAPRPLGPLVLVVDDCPYLADALALLLKWWGYRAAVAHDGPAAVALVSADPPFAVVLDIGLPGMDGCEMAARLRGLPGMGQALLVALTGYGHEEDAALPRGRHRPAPAQALRPRRATPGTRRQVGGPDGPDRGPSTSERPGPSITH